MDKAALLAAMASRQIEEAPGKRSGPTRLLDDADMNIGNAQDLTCLNQIIYLPDGNPPRILNLNAESKHASMVTVALAAVMNPQGFTSFDLNAKFGGPLTGIIEFGNGAVFTRVEIDVPIGAIELAGFLAFSETSSVVDGVAMVSVPAGTLRVYGRNDANLITPSIANLFGSPTAPDGQANQPRGYGDWFISNQQPIPCTMKAMAAYQSWTLRRRNTKTIWVYNNATTPDTIPATAKYWVPPLARTVQVFRNTVPSSLAPTNLIVTIFDGAFLAAGGQFTPLEQYNIAAGTNCPVIELPGNAMAIGVQTSGDVNSACLVFEIAV